MASEFYVSTFRNTFCSVSIGRVNKNNLGQIARVFLQVNVRLKEACASWKRRGDVQLKEQVEGTSTSGAQWQNNCVREKRPCVGSRKRSRGMVEK